MASDFNWYSPPSHLPGDLAGILQVASPVDPPHCQFDWTPRVEAWILRELAEGRTLAQVTRLGRRWDENFPSRNAIMNRIDSNPEFARQYYAARDAGVDAMAEGTIDIATDARNDFIDEEGMLRVNSDHINRSRLRVDTYKWYVSKVVPKKWGDRVESQAQATHKLDELVELFKQGPVSPEDAVSSNE